MVKIWPDSSKQESSKYKIGDEFGGGIIFHLNETGDHALIASKTDLPVRHQWGCNSQVEAFNISDGHVNTKIIVD